MIEKIVRFAIRKRVLIISFFAVVVLAGILAWKGLSIDAYPDISDTTVQVVTQVPGLAAEEIEQQITIPIERAINGIAGINTMRSKNSFGLSTVVLVFDDGVDDYWARQRVNERLAGLELPYGAVPELNPLTSPTGEIFRYIVESPDGSHDLRDLTDIQKWIIIPYLKQIAGVADVGNFGGITTQYQIELNPDRMREYGVSLADITERVESNNQNAGGSMIMEGDLSYVIRGIGLVNSLEDLGNIVIKNSPSSSPVFLRDLGNLQYGTLERKGLLGFADSERNYGESVEGIVQMLRGENPSEVLDKVHNAVDELNNGLLPEGVKIHPFMDRTMLVGQTLHTVSHTLLLGMVLVVVVLIIFLRNAKGAGVVALTIPLALLIAFILMKLTGIPANLLSLGAIDFGILVNGAIVIMETILRIREENPKRTLSSAEVSGKAAQVTKSIFFSTLIIITAYLPLFAFQHMERKLFTPMAYTVGYALIGALLVAMLLTPGLSFMAFRKPPKKEPSPNRWLQKLTSIYSRTLQKVLPNKKLLIGSLSAILLGTGILFAVVGKDFLPPLDEGSIWIQVQLPSGISLDRSSQMADNLRKKLSQFDETSYVMTQLGRDDEGAECFTLSHIEVGVGLKPYKTWKSKRTKAELVEAMSDTIANMPGFSAGFSQPIIDMVMDQVAGTHSDLAVKVYSEDLYESRRVADDLVKVLSSIPGASDVAVDQEPPTPQLQIHVDRALLAQYGINVSDVSDLIELAVGGKAISEIYQGSKVYDITCRYAEEFRNTPEKIGALLLTTAQGAQIPLNAVAEVTTVLGPNTIMRESNHRYSLVRVNLRGTELSDFIQEADKKIAEQITYNPDITSLQWAGQFENRNRAFSRLAIVLPFVLAAMFLLLVIAFGKIRHAALLLSIIPLALFGGLLALVARGMTLNVSSAVGFIALIGVALQNGVIMVSHINNLRKEHLPLDEAVVEGASHRFRAILLSATVAALGLLPASVSTGIGSDVQRPLATVIVYGLIFASIVTIFLLPSLYYLVEGRIESKKHKQ